MKNNKTNQNLKNFQIGLGGISITGVLHILLMTLDDISYSTKLSLINVDTIPKYFFDLTSKELT